jgi:hypothetical protein
VPALEPARSFFDLVIVNFAERSQVRQRVGATTVTWDDVVDDGCNRVTTGNYASVMIEGKARAPQSFPPHGLVERIVWHVSRATRHTGGKGFRRSPTNYFLVGRNQIGALAVDTHISGAENYTSLSVEATP